jgi:peptidylprolyl isomerase
MAEAKAGDVVRIHYTGKFEDGTVFDSSQGREPLEFKAGSPELIPGVSNAVVGMAEGDSKTVTVPPEEAYGPHRPELTSRVSRTELPDDVSLGDQFRVEGSGQDLRVFVSELTDDDALLDANHPLAGRTLVFDIEVVGVA